MKQSSGGRQSAPKSGSVLAYVPNEGELIQIDFSPAVGSEQKGKRFALVLTDRATSMKSGLFHAYPTTGQAKGYPYEVALPSDLKVGGVVLCDQGRTFDWRERSIAFVDTAPQHVVDDVRAKVKALLGIT